MQPVPVAGSCGQVRPHRQVRQRGPAFLFLIGILWQNAKAAVYHVFPGRAPAKMLSPDQGGPGQGKSCFGTFACCCWLDCSGVYDCFVSHRPDCLLFAGDLFRAGLEADLSPFFQGEFFLLQRWYQCQRVEKSKSASVFARQAAMWSGKSRLFSPARGSHRMCGWSM